MTKILWLTNKQATGSIGGSRFVISELLNAQGFDADTHVAYRSLHTKVPGLKGEIVEGKKKRKAVDEKTRAVALHALAEYISETNPTVIAVDDERTIHAITGKSYAQMTVAGSVYYANGIPVVCLNTVASLRMFGYGKFVYEMHLAKLVRYANGSITPEPPFNYTLCTTAEQVQQHCRAAKRASMLALDIETRYTFITSIAYTYDTPDGNVHTFAVPFFHPMKPTGEYWPGASETVVRALLRDLHASSVPKVTQNGTYDQAYCIDQHMPFTSWWLDTQIFMHSLWVEAPRDLASIASYFVDRYQYWKDDSKGVKDDTFGKTEADLLTYWRYNGLDTYYTYLGARALLRQIRPVSWALKNYSDTFSLAVGPYFAMGLRGSKMHKARHAQIVDKYAKLAKRNVESVKRFVDEPDYNPGSPQHNAWALYDLLCVKPTRLQRKGSKYGERSTDEKVLKLIKEQNNVFANHFINRLLAAKKPTNIVSNFGEYERVALNGRFTYTLAPLTDTSRCRSSHSPFWVGRNVQNVQAKLREFIVADDDYFLVEIDYSASDDRFIAYESEDPAKMELVESGKDPHCFHASVFFSMPYDKIVEGWKNEEPWCVDPISGVRQNTKRIGHGKNFLMGSTMLYNLMGREAAIATAKALGHPEAESMTDKELIAVCQSLSDKYDHPKFGMYLRLREWQDSVAVDCARNGGLASTAYGFTRKFFGDPLKEHRVRRKIAAFYGQGDTAGNINRATKAIWYDGIDDGNTIMLIKQVHDSLVFLVHKSHMAAVPLIIEIMEKPVTIHGRSMRVPVDVKVGLTWGKQMLSWKPELTYADLCAHEEKAFGAVYENDFITAIANLKFSMGSDSLLQDVDLLADDDLDDLDVQELMNDTFDVFEGIE